MLHDRSSAALQGWRETIVAGRGQTSVAAMVFSSSAFCTLIRDPTLMLPVMMYQVGGSISPEDCLLCYPW